MFAICRAWAQDVLDSKLECEHFGGDYYDDDDIDDVVVDVDAFDKNITGSMWNWWPGKFCWLM